MISEIIHNGRDQMKSKNGGFTLVEILATFVLIAIILPVAMEGISLSIKLGSRSNREIKAGTLAETKLADFILTGDWDKGDQSGKFDNDDSYYEWSLEVEDWEEDSVKQVDMSVEWTDASGIEHSVVLSTLVYVESEDE